jgi:energy-coupling factor transporter ATP-binding protein EcfA2
MASSEREPVHVVGIAGPAGAGKSTVARALARALGDAEVLHIDDYQRVTEQPVSRIAEWRSRGADFDEFDIPLLPDHLARLKRREAVTTPLSLRELRPSRFIVFETHFGRAHRASGQHVDLLAWLDTPRDVALARNLRDLVAPVLADPRAAAGRDRFAWLDSYLAAYLRDLRPLLDLQQSHVRAGADLVLDPGEDADSAAARIRQVVLERFA